MGTPDWRDYHSATPGVWVIQHVTHRAWIRWSTDEAGAFYWTADRALARYWVGGQFVPDAHPELPPNAKWVRVGTLIPIGCRRE